MQKITEIKENYTVSRRVVVDGVPTRKEKTFTRFKEVPYVDGWPRFGHFMLDRLFIVAFQFVLGITLGLILLMTQSTGFLQDANLEKYDTLFSWLIVNPFFYFIFELGMQATPGKAILGRVVVDEYGNKPTTAQIFKRSLIRIIPFEPFSCFNSVGWHDKWSNTFVIRKKDLQELKLMQKVNNIEGSSVFSQPDNDSN